MVFGEKQRYWELRDQQAEIHRQDVTREVADIFRPSSLLKIEIVMRHATP
jgi:hypothetical protein